MSLTGLDLRTRLRRRIVRVLDRVIVWLDDADVVDEPVVQAPVSAAPEAAPPKPAPAPQPSRLPPLPPLGKSLEPLPRPPTEAGPPSSKSKAKKTPSTSKAKKATPSTPNRPDNEPVATQPSPTPEAPPPEAPKPARAAPRGGETAAAAKAKASPEERQAQHQARTRKGLLRFVHDQGGKASLRDLHAYSERTFFVAHVAFSRMMEELTNEGLLDYDHDTATASITSAGQAELS